MSQASMRFSGAGGKLLLLPALLSAVLCFVSRSGLAAQKVADSQSELERLSFHAEDAQGHGNYREAAEAYQQMLKLRPDLVAARLNLGLMQFSSKDYSAAVQTFERVLRHDPGSLPANLFLGLSLLQQQQPNEALAPLERAERADPNNKRTLLALGRAYSGLRDYGHANNWYFAATRVDKTSTDAWYGLGVSYLALSREAAQRLAPAGLTSPYAQLLMAESLEQESRREDAARLYTKLSTAPSVYPCSRAVVGLGLVRVGEIGPGKQLLETELTHNPGCLLARMGLARVLIQEGSGEQALKSLREAWGVDPDVVEVNLASCLAGLPSARASQLRAWLQDAMKEEQNTPRAAVAKLLVRALDEGTLAATVRGESSAPAVTNLPISHAETPVRLFSQGRYTACTQRLKLSIERLAVADHLLLARCGYYSGDYRTSFLASSRAAKLDPRNFEGLYWRIRSSEKLATDSLLQVGISEPNSARAHILAGDAFREGEHFKEAEEEYGKAVQISPRDFAAHFGLAAASYEDAKTEEAAEELKIALDLNPDDPDANYLMGSLLVRTHRYDSAKPHLLKGLRGNPENVPHAYALLGKIDAAEGHLKEARTELERSLTADFDGSYHYQLSRVCTELGDHQAAAAALAQSEALRKASNQRAALRLAGGGFQSSKCAASGNCQ